MTAYYLGGFTVGECLPIAVTAKAGIDASVRIVLPSLEAKLAGALEVQAAITVSPPTLAVQLQAAIDLAAELQASIDLGLPGISVDLAAMASIIAEIQVELGSIQAQVALSASLGVTLGGAGVHLISQEGTLGSFGSDVGTAAGSIGASSTPCNAVCLVATTPEAWAAISAAVKTS